MRLFSKFSKLLALSVALLSLYFLQCCTSGDGDPVVEKEDVFINEVYSAGSDWLELYNSGEATKDVSGYFIYHDAKDKYTLPSNTTIPAKGFLVLTCDGTGTGLHTNFKLSSSGETVYLETPAKKLIDMVAFPPLVDGQSYARYPDGDGLFTVTGTPTQGQSNGDAQSAAITNVIKTPLVSSTEDNIKVSATVKDAGGVSSVKLFYSLNNASYTSITMTMTSGGVFEGTIPATGADGTMKYYIEAKNVAGKTSLSPADAPTNTYSFLINSDALPALFVNEFMVSNVSCCPDVENAVNEYDDWIEIYNDSESAINLAGMYLSDDPADPFKFKIPDTDDVKTTIAAKGFLVFWADQSKSQGELHANFKLSSAGESVGIYYLDGRTIDQKSFSAQADDTSYGRTTDGGLPWKVFSVPTQGSSNN
jgi:hypothetical protein